MTHACQREAHGEQPPRHHANPADDKVLEVNAHNRRVQLFAPVQAEREVVAGAVVRGGGREDAFEKEEQREDDGGGVEQRHELHQVVIYELAREDLSVMKYGKHSASDDEGGNTVAFELQISASVGKFQAAGCRQQAGRMAGNLRNKAAGGSNTGEYFPRQQRKKCQLQRHKRRNDKKYPGRR